MFHTTTRRPLINDSCGDARKSAADALVKLDKKADSQLMAALQQEDSALICEVAWIIAQRRAGSFAEQLIRITLNDSDTNVVRSTADALIKIRQNHPLSAKPFIAALNDGNQTIRLRAAAILGDMHSEEAIEPLLILMKTDTNSAVKKTAASSITKIGSPAVVPLVGAILSSHDQFSRDCWQTLNELWDTKNATKIYVRKKDANSIKGFGDILLDKHSGLQEFSAWAISEHGSDGLDILLQALASDYSETRRNAARALGKIKDPRAVESLISALQDENPIVQRTAAWALGEIKDPRAFKPLIMAIQGNEGVRMKACETLLKIGVTDISPLLDLIDNGDPDVKKKALKLLGASRDPKAIKPLTFVFKKSTDANIRDMAASALLQINDPAAIEPLLEAMGNSADLNHTEAKKILIGALNYGAELPLNPSQKNRMLEKLLSILINDRNTVIRKQAAIALGNQKDPRATASLLQVLKTDYKVAGYAADALGVIQDPQAVDPLIKLLNDSDACSVAAVALSHMKEPKAVEPLIAILEDLNHKCRASAARALGKINDERGKEPLMRALKSENKLISLNAAAALENLDNQTAVASLLANLKEPNDAIRANTILFIEERHNPRFVDALIEILKNDENAEIRKKAAVALGKIKDARACEALWFVYNNDNDTKVRRVSEIAMESIGGSKLVDGYKKPMESIIAQLESTDSQSRKLAAYALEERHDSRSVAALIKVLNDKDRNVRNSAAHTLGKLKDPSSIMPLIDIWSSGRPEDRKDSSEALAAMGPMAVEYLVPLLTQDRVSIRWRAAVTLGNIKDARALQPLIESLKDEEAEVRWAAGWALGMIGDTRATDALTAMLADNDLGLKRRAKDSLAAINRSHD